ncbi:hypothetical protein Pla144_39300 [Bythopirellula polymerisocia]|uniref:Uncharacterized protein n=1 Tax=Bythopirellula polymerisocia TaxID=2528003 RepID=A0A5C6CI50_9BACT|nr:hypothetical protein Pla144_39300 [Bythopirellula polymerisocia]
MDAPQSQRGQKRPGASYSAWLNSAQRRVTANVGNLMGCPQSLFSLKNRQIRYSRSDGDNFLDR